MVRFGVHFRGKLTWLAKEVDVVGGGVRAQREIQDDSHSGTWVITWTVVPLADMGIHGEEEIWSGEVGQPKALFWACKHWRSNSGIRWGAHSIQVGYKAHGSGWDHLATCPYWLGLKRKRGPQKNWKRGSSEAGGYSRECKVTETERRKCFKKEEAITCVKCCWKTR